MALHEVGHGLYGFLNTLRMPVLMVGLTGHFVGKNKQILVVIQPTCDAIGFADDDGHINGETFVQRKCVGIGKWISISQLIVPLQL